jgi:hypothetical protein
MLLIYYRLYLTQEFLTLLFKHQNKSSISRNISQVRPLFAEVLPTHQRARSKVLSLANKEQQRRRKRIGSVEEFKEAYPELTPAWEVGYRSARKSVAYTFVKYVLHGTGPIESRLRQAFQAEGAK